MKNKYGWIFLIILFISVTESCRKEEVEKPDAVVSENFESGSIGVVNKVSNSEWELFLADDNDNHELPDSWRNWWYVKMENLVTDAPTQITLKNRGWPYYYLPVYSYDQEEWFRFTEDEVSQNQDEELLMSKQFDSETVWIARFYPYTFTALNNYLIRIDGSPYVEIQTPGYSHNGKPLYVLKITDFNIADSNKKRVFIHARSHPAETPPSFVLEGMIDYLISGATEASEILSGFEFYIFPMHNADGVTVGNYRSTPQTENLEVMWYYDSENPLNLTDDAPQEVAIVHQYAKDLMSDGGPPVTMALNLHSSNSEPDIRPFFFPHFGTEMQGYTLDEASLWNKQVSFISSFATHYGIDMVEPIPQEGGSSFASKTYPESWWWVNFQDQVMAITMEMTYGKAGYSPRWIEPDDLRDLGVSLALGIRDYYDLKFTPDMLFLNTARDRQNLKYPKLYPPDAVDELKE